MGVFNSHKEIIYVNEAVPDPSKWMIRRTFDRFEKCAIWICYEQVKMHGGNKILVYASPLLDVINQRNIDPHFGEKKNIIYPFARFAPTQEGWDMACKFVDTVMKS